MATETRNVLFSVQEPDSRVTLWNPLHGLKDSPQHMATCCQSRDGRPLLEAHRFPARKNPPRPLKASLDVLQNAIKGHREPALTVHLHSFLRRGMLGCTQCLPSVSFCLVSSSLSKQAQKKQFPETQTSNVQCTYKLWQLFGLVTAS